VGDDLVLPIKEFGKEDDDIEDDVDSIAIDVDDDGSAAYVYSTLLFSEILVIVVDVASQNWWWWSDVFTALGVIYAERVLELLLLGVWWVCDVPVVVASIAYPPVKTSSICMIRIIWYLCCCSCCCWYCLAKRIFDIR